MVRPRRAKLLAWTREERAAERSSAMEGRAPPARPRGGGAGDPLPPVAWVPHRGASIPRGSHGNRPDRASGKPRDLRGSENAPRRSEEHTSELQSRFDLVCRLLLEKKKKK